MTRNEGGQGRHPFTAIVSHAQRSDWVRDLELGGGLIAGALVLAFAWGTMRPTPRGRRAPPRAAPAGTPPPGASGVHRRATR